jgi:hypothetical protein
VAGAVAPAVEEAAAATVTAVAIPVTEPGLGRRWLWQLEGQYRIRGGVSRGHEGTG